MITGLALGTFLLVAPLDMTTQVPAGEEESGGDQALPRTPSGHTIKEPKKTKDVRPSWPKNTFRAGLHGTVVLECTVGPDGKVGAIKPLKGYKSLIEAATRAVSRWTYAPTLLNGKPVPVIMTVTANFKLHEAPSLGDLLKSMADPDPEIRWAAVQWLGALRPPKDKQRKAVEAALQDSSPLVQNAARFSLKKLDARE